MAARQGPALVQNKGHRVPEDLPCEPDLEKLILGGIFASKDPNATFLRVSELIEDTAFSLEKTRLVFLAMQSAVSHGLSINYGTIMHELQRKDQLGRVGYLIELTEGMPELCNIESFCKIVADVALRRRMFADFADLQARVTQNDPVDEIVAAAGDALLSHQNKRAVQAIDDIKSIHTLKAEPIEFALEGVIACSAITAITGDAGMGKTTFATAAAGHIACGADFLGRGCGERKVLHLDRENALPVVQERLRRLGIQDGSNYKIWGGWLSAEAPDPGSSAVLRWVVNTQPKPLIIVDSFIAFLNGDENDANVVRTFMRQLRKLADAGAAVLLLHHTGKAESSKDYRGSSDFKASLDVGLNLTNFGEGKLDRLRLRPFKTRFAVNADLIMRYADGEFICDERPEAVSRTVSEQLGELLRCHAGVTVRAFEELAGKQGLSHHRARQFLFDGIQMGTVRREKGDRNSQLHYLNEGEDE